MIVHKICPLDPGSKSIDRPTMSRQLLETLNGDKKGLLAGWLKAQAEIEPRIAWYPSAGPDVCDLVFLSAEGDGPQAPNIFLHTDHSDLSARNPNESAPTPVIHARGGVFLVAPPPPPPPCFTNYFEAENYRIHIHAWESLGNAKGPAIYFFILRFESRNGPPKSFDRPLIHVASENRKFCDLMRAQQARISHVIVKNYGAGFGGGTGIGPEWIINELIPLGVEVVSANTLRDDLGRLGWGDYRSQYWGNDEMTWYRRP